MSKSRLQLLSEAEKDLTTFERMAFESYFVGALSILVSESDWLKALDSAAICMEQYYSKPRPGAVSRG